MSQIWEMGCGHLETKPRYFKYDLCDDCGELYEEALELKTKVEEMRTRIKEIEHKTNKKV